MEVKPAPVIKAKKDSKSFKQLAKMFFVGNFEDAKRYVLKEVVLPGLKGMVKDSADKMLNILLWDDGNVVNTNNKNSSTSSTFHNAWSKQNNTASAVTARRRYSFDPVVTQTEDDARHLLDAMEAWIKDNNYISVDDMYYLAGIPNSGDNWTDVQWGWYTMQGVGYSPCRGGWQIRMPDPVSLDIRRN